MVAPRARIGLWLCESRDEDTDGELCEPLVANCDVTVACIHAPLKRIKPKTVRKAYNLAEAAVKRLHENSISSLDRQFRKLVRYKHSFGLCRYRPPNRVETHPLE
ncbi:MAG: hypothetical protein JWP63_633 [Candidatus Solibacter sp.]|nr:hypothetical protein [Candidatus Solibacter sp.]